MSSNIQNVISTVFTARSGQAIAAMRQYSSGLSNMGGQMQQMGRNSGYMNSQLRAIGTTLRYTFAGTMVFGLARMGQELSNIQTQLALMGAVGQVIDDAGRSVEMTDKKLSSMLDTIQMKSPDALSSVEDLSAGVVNFLSSVQDYPENQVVDTVTKISQVAQIAQVHTADMTKAVTGMNQAFGRDQNIKSYEQLMRGILMLIEEAPGGIAAGGEIIQQFAPLSAVAKLARISPGQMLGGYLTVLRGGGTPSTAGRGFQYLMQSIAQPTKQGLGAQAAAGITPQLVQQRGGMWALEKMMAHAKGLGISGDLNKLQGLTDEQLDLIEQGGGAESLGITGPGMTYLRESIGRIHGIRALALLMSMKTKTGGSRYASDQAGISGFMANTPQNADEFDSQIREFIRRQPLKQMTLALISMRTQIEQDLQPLLNPVASGMTWAARQGLKHQDATKFGTYGAAGALGLWGLLRMAKGGGLKGAGRVIPGMMAVGDIGNTERGHSPASPLYVMVVGQLFGGGGGGPPIIGGPGGGRGGGAGGGRWGRFGRAVGRIGGGRVGRFGGMLARAGGAIPAGGLFAGALTAGAGMAAWELAFPEDAGGGSFATPGHQRRAMVARMQQTHLARARMMQLGAPGTNVLQLYRAQRMGEGAKAYVEIDVLVRHPDGKKERRKYHVPAEFHAGGPVPSNRGKAGARR